MEITVDVNPDDFLADMLDEDLIEELERRGYEIEEREHTISIPHGHGKIDQYIKTFDELNHLKR